MRDGFIRKASQRKRKMENRNSEREIGPGKSLGRKRFNTEATGRRAQSSPRKQRLETKKSRTKRRKPRKRRTAGPLMRLSGECVMERTKASGMGMKRDSSRRASKGPAAAEPEKLRAER